MEDEDLQGNIWGKCGSTVLSSGNRLGDQSQQENKARSSSAKDNMEEIKRGWA